MKAWNETTQNIALLGLWIALGLGLRLLNLTSKPVWTDEFATIVFSLGNSFRTVPLDQVIPMADLLAPLQPDPTATAQDTIRHLLTESNHPPLYFVLTHQWLELFPSVQGLVSVWGVRSLSAIFGTLCIPAFFGLAWLAFGSLRVAHLAAVLGAVSPFGIYLAQEARHYTLAGLWVTASLACLVAVSRQLAHQNPPSWWVCLAWIVVNALGFATHYFMAFTLVAEGLVLLALAIARYRQDDHLPLKLWNRVAVAMLGTLATMLVWVPVVQNVQNSALTDWITPESQGWLDGLAPPGRIIASLGAMFYLLPVEARELWVAILSGVGLLALVSWSFPKFYRGLRRGLRQPEWRLPLIILGGMVVGAIAIFLASAYLLNLDLTLGFRYTFVYYPAVIVLAAAALASLEYRSTLRPAEGLRRWQQAKAGFITTVLAWGLVGSLLVVNDLGFRKTHQPDVVVRWMKDEPADSTLLAMAHRTHSQTGRMMGVALEWRKQIPDVPEPEILLASHTADNPNQAILTLQETLQTHVRPFDLWLVNFAPVSDQQLRDVLKDEQCAVDTKRRRTEGYSFRRYNCQPRT
ncbi:MULTISPECIES: glycosyltransferase [unclassified Leptolyngbya]|uniref:glycosyltransferase family 39 protein n=1 Tax=unclassified Leptolyngbya TaxID=2650499 RepID=UPI001689076E|nr:MULTISPECIES: glycosyltransferase [unclassified Leptolyngbya]MBD1910134.1 glycosyltransferase [Leptolyngbya sp. FACHB-8]MBD2153566.1 glycosyltransferase [Leptolyngbya sp. FACHB-16]